MVRLGARIRTFGLILSLLAVFAMGLSVEPRQALARPVTTGGPDGTPYGTGDPTGDDVPSPTPKPTGLKSTRAPGAVTASHGITASVRWNLYLSIFIRLGLWR